MSTTFAADPQPCHCDSHRHKAVGHNLTTGLQEDQSSYRSELAGILGALSFLNILCRQYSITAGTVTIALLDGKLVRAELSHPTPTPEHYDNL